MPDLKQALGTAPPMFYSRARSDLCSQLPCGPTEKLPSTCTVMAMEFMTLHYGWTTQSSHGKKPPDAAPAASVNRLNCAMKMASSGSRPLQRMATPSIPLWSAGSTKAFLCLDIERWKKIHLRVL